PPTENAPPPPVSVAPVAALPSAAQAVAASQASAESQGGSAARAALKAAIDPAAAPDAPVEGEETPAGGASDAAPQTAVAARSGLTSRDPAWAAALAAQAAAPSV